jgi:hypothetical protein
MESLNVGCVVCQRNMAHAHSFERSVPTYQTTRRHIPEARNLDMLSALRTPNSFQNVVLNLNQLWRSGGSRTNEAFEETFI